MLIVAHRKELVEQIQNTLKKVFFFKNSPVPSAEGAAAHISVMSIQWLSRNIDMVRKKYDERKENFRRDVESLDYAKPCKIGTKWWLRGSDGRILCVPKYRSVMAQNDYFLIEDMPLHWGVMDKFGKVLVEPKHDKVEITPDGKAVITSVSGKQTIIYELVKKTLSFESAASSRMRAISRIIKMLASDGALHDCNTTYDTTDFEIAEKISYNQLGDIEGKIADIGVYIADVQKVYDQYDKEEWYYLITSDRKIASM